MITLPYRKIQEERWTLVEDLQDEVEGFYRAVEEHLRRLRPPDVTWKRESAAPSTMKVFTGKRREGLVVTHPRFREYLTWIAARGYGATLDVCCCHAASTRAVILDLLARIPFVSRALNLIGILRDLDIFDLQDLRAWRTVTETAVTHALDDVTAKRNLEVTVNWKSKGKPL